MEEFLKLFNLQDILLHILNTVILFVAIRLLVYKPIRKYLNARTDRVTGEMEAANAMRTQAEETLAIADEERKAAERAAVQAQAEGAQRAQNSSDQLLAATRAQADEILRQAQDEATAMKAAAREEIQAQALSMAVEIAEKMIGRELAVRDNETLAREFLTKVG